MRRLMLIVAMTLVPADSTQICPDLGEDAACYNDGNNCAPDSVWEEKTTVCGLCPGCKQYIQGNGTCTDGLQPSCVPGYSCVQSVCVPASGSCMEKLQDPCLHWTPQCVGVDYAPRQCKGSRPTGRCFCVDEKGIRIFGDQLWSKAENMTCACSRRVEALRSQGRKDVTLHCTEEGNYEALQCDDGLCWCAEEKTGIATSSILPENMVTMLHCYNRTLVGSQYLRRCESQLIAQGRIEIEMGYHGSYNPLFAFLRCDMDGTYAPVQQVGNLLKCVSKENGNLGSYASEKSGLATMNCRCAREEVKYNIALECMGNGNYNSKQYTSDGNVYDVDEDGFPYKTDCLPS